MSSGQQWDGGSYQARFDALAASGVYVHGEAELVASYRPTAVLDAGCGTGRVAIELARRGVRVLGVDRDDSMLATARAVAPALDWRRVDLADPGAVALPAATFDVVVMAGNVLLFADPGTEGAVVANLAATLVPGGRLIAGFSLRPGGYDVAGYDADCTAAGLALEDRWATWERAPFVAGGDYAVSVHRAADRRTSPPGR